jgi:hypothetical protein
MLDYSSLLVCYGLTKRSVSRTVLRLEIVQQNKGRSADQTVPKPNYDFPAGLTKKNSEQNFRSLDKKIKFIFKKLRYYLAPQWESNV